MELSTPTTMTEQEKQSFEKVAQFIASRMDGGLKYFMSEFAKESEGEATELVSKSSIADKKAFFQNIARAEMKITFSSITPNPVKEKAFQPLILAPSLREEGNQFGVYSSVNF